MNGLSTKRLIITKRVIIITANQPDLINFKTCPYDDLNYAIIIYHSLNIRTNILFCFRRLNLTVLAALLCLVHGFVHFVEVFVLSLVKRGFVHNFHIF